MLPINDFLCYRFILLKVELTLIRILMNYDKMENLVNKLSAQP